MLNRHFSLCTLVAVLPLLMAFRLETASTGSVPLLYDVRGAFVAARPDVSAVLVSETDRLVNEAIITTVRQRVLPRTILTVRIESLARLPVLFGGKREAAVSVKAVAVTSGEVIAEGGFDVTVYSLNAKRIELLLAQGIADRVASEFQLSGERRSTLATALSSGR